MTTPSEHAREILERGYTVLLHTHTDDDVGALRSGVRRIHQEHGAPPAYALPMRDLGGGVMVNPTGFVMPKLLGLAPALAPRILSARLVEVARALLGEDMHLELTGAVLSDGTRPFFGWHNHIGGIDVEDYWARRDFPSFTRCERVIAVTYLQDVDAESGDILALPRRITDPTAPPCDHRAATWPGEVVINFPRGSTLVLEQATWHAVRPMRRGGDRMFIGCYLTSAAAPPTRAVDDTLRGFSGGGELLQSVLPRR